MNNYF